MPKPLLVHLGVGVVIAKQGAAGMRHVGLGYKHRRISVKRRRRPGEGRRRR
ncbi:hypothetical protein MOP88_06680 [Sphingomonas sp. WKB10]|nr:hypothetical protein [Sphingomonas sp. WKB10]